MLMEVNIEYYIYTTRDKTDMTRKLYKQLGH